MGMVKIICFHFDSYVSSMMFDDLPDDRAMRTSRLTRSTADLCILLIMEHARSTLKEACRYSVQGTRLGLQLRRNKERSRACMPSLVHRGLKPANFLIDDDNCPLRADFGHSDFARRLAVSFPALRRC